MAAIYDVNSHASIGDFYAKCHNLGTAHAATLLADCPEFGLFGVSVTLYPEYAFVSVTLHCEFTSQETSEYSYHTVDGYKVTLNVFVAAMKVRRAELNAVIDAKIAASKA